MTDEELELLAKFIELISKGSGNKYTSPLTIFNPCCYACHNTPR